MPSWTSGVSASCSDVIFSWSRSRTSQAQPLEKWFTASSPSFCSIGSMPPNPSSISCASLPLGCCFSGLRHCQKKLWFHSWALLLNSFFSPLLARLADKLDQRSAGEIRLALDQLIGFLDVGARDACRDETRAFQRTCAAPARPSRMAARAAERPWRAFLLGMRECRRNECRAAEAPRLVAEACDLMFRGRKKFPTPWSGKRGRFKWGRFFENLNVYARDLALASGRIALMAGYASST